MNQKTKVPIKHIIGILIIGIVLISGCISTGENEGLNHNTLQNAEVQEKDTSLEQLVSEDRQNQDLSVPDKIDNSIIIQYPNKTAYIPVKKITENRVIEVTQDKYKNDIFHMINGEKFSFKNFAYAYGKIRTYNIARNKRPYDIFMGPNLDPTDGEIEGYIFHDFLPNDTILTYIYVDQDWKENIENTHIIWGESANWDNYTHKKKFNFQKIADGIYRDVFVDDRDRFSDDYMTGHGGVKVGNESLWLGSP